jgi:surfactin family lipopeptide synthetase A
MLVHELFEAQVRKTPDNVAVTFDGSSLTYGELNIRANQLARCLRTLGVGPEIVVGICMDRSPELVVAILGVLKAGGACMPLDPAYPKERLEFMLEDAEAPILLTQQHVMKTLFQEEGPRIEDRVPRPSTLQERIKLVRLDSEWKEIARQDSEDLRNEAAPDNLAFVFYTSGSTGKPKAVMWCHSRRDRVHSWQQATYQLTEQDQHLLKSSIGFTLLSKEMFLPLLTGARMIVVPAGLEGNASSLVKLINEHRITIITVVPSMLRALLEHQDIETCTSLRHVCTFGEPLPVSLQERFFSRLNAELTANYGATEAPSATSFRYDRKSPQPIIGLGHPVPEKEIYLLDESLRRLPVAVSGEIYLGGKLARGYLKQPDLTAEKFIPHLFSQEPGARLYRTGDLGRYLADGGIEFLGRADDQIKVRGFRIEPSEIEKTIREHPSVQETILIAREDRPGSKRLVAYLVSNHNQPPTIKEMRNFLKQKLPDHMVPSAFMFLEDLPRMANGKVDRRALPDPGRSRPDLDTPFVAPRAPVEKELAQIWADVLCLDQVGIHDDFLELGGDSLVASQVISRVIKSFQLDLPVQALFQSPTVAEMAEVIAQNQAKKLSEEDLARILAELESLSEDQAQEFVDRGEAETVKDKGK